jgi:hypothetical protein
MFLFGFYENIYYFCGTLVWYMLFYSDKKLLFRRLKEKFL